jgi:hypothetical protein
MAWVPLVICLAGCGSSGELVRLHPHCCISFTDAKENVTLCDTLHTRDWPVGQWHPLFAEYHACLETSPLKQQILTK